MDLHELVEKLNELSEVNTVKVKPPHATFSKDGEQVGGIISRNPNITKDKMTDRAKRWYDKEFKDKHGDATFEGKMGTADRSPTDDEFNEIQKWAKDRGITLDSLGVDSKQNLIYWRGKHVAKNLIVHGAYDLSSNDSRWYDVTDDESELDQYEGKESTVDQNKYFVAIVPQSYQGKIESLIERGLLGQDMIVLASGYGDGSTTWKVLLSNLGKKAVNADVINDQLRKHLGSGDEEMPKTNGGSYPHYLEVKPVSDEYAQQYESVEKGNNMNESWGEGKFFDMLSKHADIIKHKNLSWEQIEPYAQDLYDRGWDMATNLEANEIAYNLKQLVDPKRAKKEQSMAEGFTGESLEAILEKHADAWINFRDTGELSEEFYNDLYVYFANSGDMPYGTMKARTGDPYEWIGDRLQRIIDNEKRPMESHDKDHTDWGVHHNCPDGWGKCKLGDDENCPAVADNEYGDDEYHVGEGIEEAVKLKNPNAQAFKNTKGRLIGEIYPMANHPGLWGAYHYGYDFGADINTNYKLNSKQEAFKQLKDLEIRFQDVGLDEEKEGSKTVYPNAKIIKTNKGREVGEIYPMEDQPGLWGAFHYGLDFGADTMDSRQEAFEQLRDLHDEYVQNRGGKHGAPFKEQAQVNPEEEKKQEQYAQNLERTMGKKITQANPNEIKMAREKVKAMMGENTMKKVKKLNEDVVVNVSATGEDAIAMLRKLSGIDTPAPVPATPHVAAMPMQSTMVGSEAVEEADDDRPYDNSPNEEEFGVDAQITQGDDLNRPKTSFKKEYPGDNPMAVTEEEVEEIDEDTLGEKLGKSDPAGKWIGDFQKSDNPKFAGKSKEKRKDMALGAYYAKQREGKEESVEEKLDELKVPSKFQRMKYSAAYGKQPEDVIRDVKNMKAGELSKIHTSYQNEPEGGVPGRHRGSPQDVQKRAIDKEFKKRNVPFIHSESIKDTIEEVTQEKAEQVKLLETVLMRKYINEKLNEMGPTENMPSETKKVHCMELSSLRRDPIAMKDASIRMAVLKKWHSLGC